MSNRYASRRPSPRAKGAVKVQGGDANGAKPGVRARRFCAFIERVFRAPTAEECNRQMHLESEERWHMKAFKPVPARFGVEAGLPEPWERDAREYVSDQPGGAWEPYSYERVIGLRYGWRRWWWLWCVSI